MTTTVGAATDSPGDVGDDEPRESPRSAVVGMVVLAHGVAASVVGDPGVALRISITSLLGAAMGLLAPTARVASVKDAGPAVSSGGGCIVGRRRAGLPRAQSSLVVRVLRGLV